jgi:type VI secretion system protein ImpH
MAPESGTENLSVTDIVGVPPSIRLKQVEQELRDHPGEFEFFQAVRLMLRILSDRENVGGFASIRREAMRFGVNSSLSFPPSQILSINWDEDIPFVTVNFMGLTGPMGVLPYVYSELITARARNRDRSMAAFFDIFNHRMISLFYRAWEKYRSPVAYEREGEDRLSQYLMSLIGLGTPGLEDRMEIQDESLIFYAGLLSLQPRSATALQHILEDYFGVPVEVEQFVGAWQKLDAANQCIFGFANSLSEQLGVAAVVGDEIWDQQSRVRLKLGPLTQEQYLSFLPSGSANRPLRELTRFFCGPELEVEAQLILKREEVPACSLGDDGLAGPRLGWFTWVKSGAAFDRAPQDTILLLA